MILQFNHTHDDDDMHFLVSRETCGHILIKTPLVVDVVAVRLGDQSAIRWPSGKTGWEAANSCHTES